MKQTSMQDLKEDLILTIDSANNALLEIEDEGIRTACQEVVKITLKKIIKRIDEELLEMEKQQIENAFTDGITGDSGAIDAEQYYNETYNNK